jgi:phosphoglycolate phosphatase
VVYVGDDYRDILSGHHAGCHTVAAAFGFCSSERPVADWGADAIAKNSAELASLLLS